MRVDLNGKVLNVKVTEKSTFVTIGDASTFTKVQLSVSGGASGFVEGQQVNVTGEVQIVDGKFGAYLPITDLKISKMGGGEK